MSYRFPIARKLLAFAGRARRNWLDRHRVPANFWIHMLGIPLAFAGIPLLFVAEWYWGAGAIVVGYLLQWIGHRIEGNDVGELIPLKRLLGLPVVAIAPRSASVGVSASEKTAGSGFSPGGAADGSQG
jgi:hypothetical protein